jgi:D-methionine transport system substrate-binding protein
MGRRLGLRATVGALLLACGLSSAQANSDPHTIVFGVAPGHTATWSNRPLSRH